MTEYRSNSHKSKAEVQTVEKKQKLQGRKKSSLDRATDDAKDIGSYLMKDVIIPKVIDALAIAGKNAIDMIFYKEVKGNNKSGHTSYRRYYDEPNDRFSSGHNGSRGIKYTDIVVKSRSEAEDIYAEVEEIINEYDGAASVNQFCDIVNSRYDGLIDMPSNYTGQKYGWYSKDWNNARIVREDDGYWLKLPKPRVI